MAGLNHDFLLLPDDGDRASQAFRHINSPEAITLHDDLVEYFWDTLKWIPTEIPARRKAYPGLGLNRYGPTAISGAGAVVAASVFRSWAALLTIGPASLELTGPWSCGPDEPISKGSYTTLRVDRDDLVGKCLAVAKLADQAQQPGFWLCHWGI